MSLEYFQGALVLLAGFAVFDLVVGVSNDAVNFLNSPIGSRVASRKTIFFVASLGILVGVTFSSGMMEVARKGIFHPGYFTMPELMYLCLAVMIGDIILLDLFSTFGLPTSTTVSIVFELLGGAVGLSVIKVLGADGDLGQVTEYINTSKALIIVFGILLSVVVAFLCGVVAQFLSRLLFTFDFGRRVGRYGALWGGVAMAVITYFILIKGAKGSTLIPPDAAAWIESHAGVILGATVPAAAIVLQGLVLLRVNIFKPIILVGTFALAMAFAANDLVNFIGVPVAGLHAFRVAAATSDPLTATMGALAGKVPTSSVILLLSGAVMVLTLWFSRKAHSVIDTTLNLSQQGEMEERFESSFLSRFIVRFVLGAFNFVSGLIPPPVRRWAAGRLDPSAAVQDTGAEAPSFDVLRASVNLMAASAVISYATSQKLPLSTTYVTFMVAMGTSFADQAWGRESAVYRVTGVITVVGSWFMTAVLAFSLGAAFVAVMYYTNGIGLLALLPFAGFVVWKNHHRHGARARAFAEEKVFNLKKVESVAETKRITFEHVGFLLEEIRISLNGALEALFTYKEVVLTFEKARTRKIQRWANIITANVFKTMRLLQTEEVHATYMYGQATRRLQKLVDGHRDIVMRAYLHVSDQHKGLLAEQVEELREVQRTLNAVLLDVQEVVRGRKTDGLEAIQANHERLNELASRFHQRQMERIRTVESKTRLSILFYAIIGNSMNLSKQSLKLLEIFKESLNSAELGGDFD